MLELNLDFHSPDPIHGFPNFLVRFVWSLRLSVARERAPKPAWLQFQSRRERKIKRSDNERGEREREIKIFGMGIFFKVFIFS